MSLDIIIAKSKMVEGALKRLGYQGRGIHELINNAGPGMPDDVSRVCRRIATLRNKSVHEEGFSIPSYKLNRFCQDADWAVERLNSLRDAPSGSRATARRREVAADVLEHSYSKGRGCASKILLGVVMIILMIVGASFYLAWDSNWRKDEADLKLGLDASRMLDVRLHLKSELIVQRLTAFVTTNVECDGRIFNPSQRTKAPVSLSYTLDLNAVGPSSYLWDASSKRLTVKVPDVRIGKPNIDSAAQVVRQDGVFISRTCGLVLARKTAKLQRSTATAEAEKPENLRRARTAARKAVTAFAASILSAAGLSNVTVVAALPGDTEHLTGKARSLADAWNDT